MCGGFGAKERDDMTAEFKDGYQYIPDRGDDWQPTKKELREQKKAEDLRNWAEKTVAGMPPMTEEQVTAFARDMDRWRKEPKVPDSEMVKWRVRLFCGHVNIKIHYYKNKTLHEAFWGSTRCDECGRDPVTIVAAEAIGRVAEPEKPAVDVAKVKKALRRHEREAARLRAELEEAGETQLP